MQYKGILSTIYDKFSESRSFRTNFYLPLSRVIGWLLEWQILPMSDLINGVQVFSAHFEQADDRTSLNLNSRIQCNSVNMF